MGKEYRITIAGMGCAHCVKSVTEALTAIGASVKQVQIGRADVAYDGDVNNIKDAIEDRGFDVTGIAEA